MQSGGGILNIKSKGLIAALSLVITTTVNANSNESMSVMFWNVENLFDTIDDPDRQDTEFTPGGSAKWTEEVLAKKMQALATVIKSVKSDNGKACPDFLGMAEVESGSIAKRLNTEYLKECGYTKIIADPKDPDIRGIRAVSLTRLPLAARPVSHQTYNGGRFIQEVSVKVGDTTAILFVNHWKSRRSNGSDTGEDKRVVAGKVLHDRINKIIETDPEAEIMAMGDFNDEPENKSFRDALGSTINLQKFIDDETHYMLWNPSADLLRAPAIMSLGEESDNQMAFYRKIRSTYYYGKGDDYLAFDNFHFSRGLLDDLGLTYKRQSFEVVRHSSFTDAQHRPIRFQNSNGKRGASDHFPILARFKNNSF